MVMLKQINGKENLGNEETQVRRKKAPSLDSSGRGEGIRGLRPRGKHR